MQSLKALLVFLMILLPLSPVALASDFVWLRDLNVQAQADPSGFRATLGARFKIGDLEIKTVLSNVERPADAYMVLRLAEMSRRPADYVITQYRSDKGKGWGALAKSMGIKPGSSEFHALKKGHDLHGDMNRVAERQNGAGREKGGDKKRK